MVMGGVICPRDREMESQWRILTGSFFTIICSDTVHCSKNRKNPFSSLPQSLQPATSVNQALSTYCAT